MPRTTTQLSTRPQAVKRRATAARNGNQLGRPAGTGVTYGREHAERVLELLREGETLSSICRQDGMPSIGRVLGWVDGQSPPFPDFGERFARDQRQGWQAMGYQVMDESRAAVGKDMPGVAAQKLVVDTMKWLLSRRLPDTFGDRLQLDGSAAARAEIHVYLPGKDGRPGDDAKIIDGSSSDPHALAHSKDSDGESS